VPKRRFHVFVDETGERSLRPRTKPVFAVSAVIVPDTHVRASHALLDRLNADLGKPPGTTLHWAKNVKQHHQRKHVAEALARAHLGVTNVLVVKGALTRETGLYDGARIYNYAIRRLLERVSWFVKKRRGEAVLTFAHIRHFPYEKLFSYMEILREQETSIAWQTLPNRPKIDQPHRVRGLQLADLAAGIVSTAVHADQYGRYEASYLHSLIPRLNKERGRPITSYGMNVVGTRGCMARYPWWAAFEAACS
jgi:Protein of unknown function (DUF3800)